MVPPLQRPNINAPPRKKVASTLGKCQVQCLNPRCESFTSVKLGSAQFMCRTCGLFQDLPADTIWPNKVPRKGYAPYTATAAAKNTDPTKIQISCVNCKTIVNIQIGSKSYVCPQCSIKIKIDFSQIFQAQYEPRVSPRPPPEEVHEVVSEVEREEDGGLAEETFADYLPSKHCFGLPHPDPIVETSCLSAIHPPQCTYDPKIKDDLENSNLLSCLQIEAMIYACQRHLQFLPNGARGGFFLGDGAGVGKGRTVAALIWENWNCGRRKSIWISIGSDLKYDARRDLDDVGAKCVKVHALNKLPYSKLDSKICGVREGVVFLTYSCLIASSDRGHSRLQQIIDWCGKEFDGIIVFDECHKAKNLVPKPREEPTKTGQAVVNIQDRLPQARVVYCSATGASEPRNLGYMVRLGLWGPGTAFIGFPDMLDEMEKGGLGAMELVAMDMKARGMYVCRTLSYKGAEFDIVEVSLEERMVDMYNKAADFWSQLKQEFVEVAPPNSRNLWRLYWATHQRFFKHMCVSAKVTDVVRISRQALMESKCVVIGLQSTGEARMEGAVVKYGLELDDFISGPRELLLKFIDEHYPLPDKPDEQPPEKTEICNRRKRHSDVSLRGRWAKYAKRDFEIYEIGSDSEPEPESDDEFRICSICNSGENMKTSLSCSTCHQLFHDACLFPPLTEEIYGDWSCHSCVVKKKHGNNPRKQILNDEKLKNYESFLGRKSKILEKIHLLDLPNNPLDNLIDQLGGPDNVAEITGRRGMLVRDSGGGVVYQPRNTRGVPMEMVNMHEKQMFMDGKKLIAIISEAGSAGVSLHADRRVPNQKRRVHLTLELPWSADRAIQQFGRTHRSNQTSAPEYRLLFTNLGGERRFASIVAKRLEILGALTQGDRRAGPSLSAYNYDTDYGNKALDMLYRGLMGKEPFMPGLFSSNESDTVEDFIMKAKKAFLSVGILEGEESDSGNISGNIANAAWDNVGRFLNRILGMRPNIQNRLFDCFSTIFDRVMEKARVDGKLDLGIVKMRGKNVELKGVPKIVHTDAMSGAFTVLFTFSLDRGMTWESASQLLAEKQKYADFSSKSGFYISKREWMGKLQTILAFENSGSRTFKVYRPATGESIRDMPSAELRSKYQKVSGDLEKVRHDWKNACETAAKQCMHGPKCKSGRFCTVGRTLQIVHILGGLILPIWGTIGKALSKQSRPALRRIRVMHVETTSDNQRIIGLLVPNAAVESVLNDLPSDE